MFHPPMLPCRRGGISIRLKGVCQGTLSNLGTLAPRCFCIRPRSLETRLTPGIASASFCIPAKAWPFLQRVICAFTHGLELFWSYIFRLTPSGQRYYGASNG